MYIAGSVRSLNRRSGLYHSPEIMIMKEHITQKEIESLAERKIGGESYADIRRELESRGFSEQQVRDIIAQVDKVVLERESNPPGRISTRSVRIAGYVLATLGVLLYLGYYLRWWTAESYKLIIFLPMIAGLVLIWSARFVERRRNR